MPDGRRYQAAYDQGELAGSLTEIKNDEALEETDTAEE
jgi:hypothetical protein